MSSTDVVSSDRMSETDSRPRRDRGIEAAACRQPIVIEILSSSSFCSSSDLFPHHSGLNPATRRAPDYLDYLNTDAVTAEKAAAVTVAGRRR